MVIPEAKTAWGLVTYESGFAPLLRSSPIPRVSPPVYDAPATWYPQDYDLLQVMIEEDIRCREINAKGVSEVLDYPLLARRQTISASCSGISASSDCWVNSSGT